MLKENVSRKQIAETINVNYNTVCNKIKGKRQKFNFFEAVTIKKKHFPKAELEELFKNDTEEKE